MEKVYVLDTNVLVHDPEALMRFEDNEVVVPIAVIAELDNLKRGHGEIPTSVRKVLRLIDSFREQGDISKGVPLPGGGRLRVDTGDKTLTFDKMTTDDTIIMSAVSLINHSRLPVVLVTKDTAVRIKAESLGVAAQDYRSDKSTAFQKCGHILDDGEQHDEVGSVRYRRLGEEIQRLRGNGVGEPIRRNRSLMGITPRNIEQDCAMDALVAKGIEVVALTGRPGSGKTLLALAAGIELCTRMRASHEGERSGYEQVMVARPIVPMGQDLGYLPGELEEKLGPWMQPIYDNLDVIVGTPREGKGSTSSSKYRSSEYLVESGIVHIEPLTYIRGRSLPNRYLIVDEAQNLRPLDVKTIITRCGEGTKVVLTGDLEQIDQPYLDATSNGLAYLVNRFINEENFCYLDLTLSARSALAERASELL